MLFGLSASAKQPSKGSGTEEGRLRCPACGRTFRPPADFCPKCRAYLRTAASGSRPSPSLPRRLILIALFLAIAIVALRVTSLDDRLLAFLESRDVDPRVIAPIRAALTFPSSVPRPLSEIGALSPEFIGEFKEGLNFLKEDLGGPKSLPAKPSPIPGWPPKAGGSLLNESEAPLVITNLPWAGYRSFDDILETYRRSEESRKSR